MHLRIVMREVISIKNKPYLNVNQLININSIVPINCILRVPCNWFILILPLTNEFIPFIF